MPIMEGQLLMLPLLGEELHPLTDSEFIESHKSGDYHKAWENRAKIQGKIPVSYGEPKSRGRSPYRMERNWRKAATVLTDGLHTAGGLAASELHQRSRQPRTARKVWQDRGGNYRISWGAHL